MSLEQIDLLYQNSTPLTSTQYREHLITGEPRRVVEDITSPVKEVDGEKWTMEEVQEVV